MTNIVLQPQSQMHEPPPGIAPEADVSIRLWHDDIRRPPSGWVWARTNAQAKLILLRQEVSIISMDHDLGGHELDPDMPNAWLYKGASTDETGLDLVDWMIAEQQVPETVIIHSMNAPCAISMKKTLLARGYLNVYVRPYQPPAQPLCSQCGESSCWRVGGRGFCGSETI